MSRCFPFPPPGYELKARPDDVNLRIKDKHKHKKQKHKKEKEGSEGKDKERSENKHKEDKKRKREEEKDKKDKEDKKKEKQSSSGVFLENHNGNDLLAIKDTRECNRVVNDQSLSFWELDKVEKITGGKERIVKDPVKKMEDKRSKEEKHHIKKEEKRRRKEEKKKRKEQKKKENIDCHGKLPKLKEFNDFLDAKDSGVRPYNMSRPAIVSHKDGHIGGGFRPSQNTINPSVGERAADQKVNLSSPQSVIDGVRNIGPCQTANNRITENGRVSVSVGNHVVSNGIISPCILRFERKVEPSLTGRSNDAAMVKQINHSGNVKIPSLHPCLDDEGQLMHSRESRMNDSLEGKKPSSSMPLSVCLKGKEKVASVTKPPHPDMKYLNQILSVPQLEWPQCDDDQEWLFGSQSKRPKLASLEIQLTKQVWSEAVELESADVTALPYVIPY